MRLNAMKSGVQPKTAGVHLTAESVFECDEERSATYSFALNSIQITLFECDEERSATENAHEPRIPQFRV